MILAINRVCAIAARNSSASHYYNNSSVTRALRKGSIDHSPATTP